MLTMTRTAWDESGRGVEYGSHVYRASRYSFELTLTVGRRTAGYAGSVTRSPAAGVAALPVVVVLVLSGGVRVVLVVLVLRLPVVDSRPAADLTLQGVEIHAGELYFSWRATFVCLALARAAPLARPPYNREGAAGCLGGPVLICSRCPGVHRTLLTGPDVRRGTGCVT